MYQVEAESLVRIGESFDEINKFFDGGLVGSQLPVGTAQIAWLRTHLPIMAAHCNHLQLPTTHAVIMGFYRDYKTENPNCKEAQTRLACIRETFKAELTHRLCLFVHAHKSAFYTSPLAPATSELDTITLEKFPSVADDFFEAGRCYAFEQNTACVFHSMRVLERGLHTLANDLGLNPKIPIILMEWRNLIEQIESKIRELGNSLPKGLHKAETLKIYSDAASEFWHFKEAWRNHVMHSRENYGEHDAIRILAHVRSFMRCLATTGLQEIQIVGPVTAPSL